MDPRPVGHESFLATFITVFSLTNSIFIHEKKSKNTPTRLSPKRIVANMDDRGTLYLRLPFITPSGTMKKFVHRQIDRLNHDINIFPLYLRHLFFIRQPVNVSQLILVCVFFFCFYFLYIFFLVSIDRVVATSQ